MIKYLWISNTYSKKLFKKYVDRMEGHTLSAHIGYIPNWFFVDSQPSSEFGEDLTVLIYLRKHLGELLADCQIYDRSATSTARRWSPETGGVQDAETYAYLATINQFSCKHGGYNIRLRGFNSDALKTTNRHEYDRLSKRVDFDTKELLSERNIPRFLRLMSLVPSITEQIMYSTQPLIK